MEMFQVRIQMPHSGLLLPTSALRDTSDIQFSISKAGVAGFDIFNKGTTGTEIGNQDPYPLLFKTNNTVKATLDSSGNLGIGVTSITGGYKAQINGNLLLGTAANPLLVGTTSLNFLGDNTSSFGMRLDSSGNLGIGTTSPGAKLDVNGDLKVSPNTAGRNTFTLTTNASNDGRLLIKSDTTNKVDIQANGSSYFEGGTVRFISTISVGNATPSASGAGITFPASDSPSSDANTLDDYEEGTFTPNQGSGLTVVGTFSSSATYTKIGRQVTVTGKVSGTTSVAASSDGVICSNLPFTPASLFVGGTTNGPCTVSSGLYVNSVNVNASEAMVATTDIHFTVTFFV